MGMPTSCATVLPVLTEHGSFNKRHSLQMLSSMTAEHGAVLSIEITTMAEALQLCKPFATKDMQAVRMQDGVTMHAQKVLRGGALAQYWAGTLEFKLQRGDATARSSLAYTALPSIWMPLVPQNTCKHPDPYHAQRWTPPRPAALARRPTRRPWPGLPKPPCFPALPLQLHKPAWTMPSTANPMHQQRPHAKSSAQ